LSEQLLSKLAPRLRSLNQGGYERAYLSKGRRASTSTHQLVADLLDSLGIGFKMDVKVPGAPRLAADFVANGTWIFVERDLNGAELRALAARKTKSVMILREASRSDRLDHGIRVLGLGEGGRRQTIFLDDPSFNFDYAHILPKTEKCSVMHGHTSSVLVEVAGRPVEGMVVDFGVAKQIVRDAVRSRRA